MNLLHRAVINRHALLNDLLRALYRLKHDDSGQGILEYIVILSACLVGCLAIAKQIMKAMNTGILRLGSQLEQDLKTGRVPLSAWDN